MKAFSVSQWKLSDKKDNEEIKELGEFKVNFTKDEN